MKFPLCKKEFKRAELNIYKVKGFFQYCSYDLSFGGIKWDVKKQKDRTIMG